MNKLNVKEERLLTQLKLARKGLNHSKSLIQANGKNLTAANRESLNRLFNKINPQKIQLVLADDDCDDRMLFKKALEDLPLNTNLITVSGGDELMELLEKENGEIPTLLFLDLNMPEKNGFDCLIQIRNNKKLKHLFITVLTTSVNSEELSFLHKNGAQQYIHKPGDFLKLKQVIYNSIKEFIFSFPGEEDFLFQY